LPQPGVTAGDGGLAVLLGLVWLPLGQLAAALAWPFVAYTNRVVELLGGIQGGDLEIGPPGLLPVLLFYAILFGWTFAAGRLRSAANAIKPALALALLGGLAAFVWHSALAAPDGRLHLTLLAAGGDAVLIQAPGGGAVLAGGCPSASRVSAALGRRLPPLHRRLDWVIVPTSGKDQLDGMERLLERFPADNLLWAGEPGGLRPARDLGELLAEADTAPLIAQTGQSLELGSGAALRVRAAGEGGALLLLEWENFYALLPVGREVPALEPLPPGLGPVDVLLLPGSGPDWTASPEWIERLDPLVVLYAGDELTWPDSETSRALQGRNMLRADRNGWVHVSTDGEQMWVEVERR
jgi:beta-lactamase superfamily II metal-dependent hydrolase